MTIYNPVPMMMNGCKRKRNLLKRNIVIICNGRRIYDMNCPMRRIPVQITRNVDVMILNTDTREG